MKKVGRRGLRTTDGTVVERPAFAALLTQNMIILHAVLTAV